MSLLAEHAACEREVAQAVRARVGQALAGVVVLGQRARGVGVGVVLRDGAEVAVEQAGHAHRDLEQELGEVELHGERRRRVDQHVDLTLAGELRGEVVAAADGLGEVVDVVLVDAPVAAGRARARQEAGRRPAADGDRGDAEPPRRLLHAQEHAGNLAAAAPQVNALQFRKRAQEGFLLQRTCKTSCSDERSR